MSRNETPPEFDTPHGRILFIAAMVCLLAQFLFLVALKVDRSAERRIYWGSSAAVIGCLLLLPLPHWKLGAQLALGFTFMFVVLAFFRTPYLKIGGRIYAANVADRRPDSVADELYSPPRISNTVRTRWVLVALAGVIVACSLWYPESTSRPSIKLPVAAGIGAGVGIEVSYADGSGSMGCTAGFLVRTGSGQDGLLTAGHCNRPGGPAQVTINYANESPYRVIGTVNRSVAVGKRHDHDMALVLLDGTERVPVIADVSGRPITGVTSFVAIGEIVCHVGLYTQTEKCGPVTLDAGRVVIYDAPGGCGDSGGPAYIVRNGAAVAVGIHVAGTGAKDSDSCGQNHQRSAAELIQPWLDEWQLTIVTTPR